MPHTFRVALLGFSDFERSTMASYFRLAAPSGSGYELVGADDDSDFILADADHAPSVQLVRTAERLRDTVFVGNEAPADAVAWTTRPIDPLRVMRELDALRREANDAPAAGDETPAPAASEAAASDAAASESTPTPPPASVEPDAASAVEAGDAPDATATPEAAAVLRDFFADEPAPGAADAPATPATAAGAAPEPDAAAAPVAAPAAPAAPAAAPRIALGPAGELPLPEVTEVDAAEAEKAAAAEPDLVLDLNPHAQPWQAVPDLPLATPVSGPPSALIVDDSAIALRFLASRLEPWGLTMDCVVNSTQALECLAERDYDFIFIDVELGLGSDLDGLALCQRIKREHPLSTATLVIVSAHHSELDRVRGWLAGCDVYLAKPLQAVELARLLARRGLKPPPAAAALLRRKAPA